MATVTGYTAARMLQIENETVISGLVDTNGDLLLYTRANVEINAGHVVGPEGAPGTTEWAGILGKPITFPPSSHGHNVEDIAFYQSLLTGTSLPSEWPFGVSMTDGADFPESLGICITTKYNNFRCSQIFTAKDTGSTYIRSATNDTTWTAWRKTAFQEDPGVVKAVATGSYSSGSTLSSGSGVSVSRTFPSGLFTSTPRVVCIPTKSARIQMAAMSVTTTGFTARLDNFSGGTAADRDFNWIAIQET